jgi:hypothetical protein
MQNAGPGAGWSWWPSTYSHSHGQPTGHGLRSLGARQELVLAVLADDSLQLVTWTGKVMRVVGNKTRQEERYLASHQC